MNPQVIDVYHYSDIIFQRHSITPNSSKSLTLARSDAPTPCRRIPALKHNHFSNDEPLPYAELLPWIILTAGVGAGGSSK
jgi:hypothetical protein